ncbi:MAG: serine/threonine-protein kinase [Deltaproteobacteria bacterium]
MTAELERRDSYAPFHPCVPGFDVVRELGSGGMAIVYEAQRGSDAVALKVLMTASNDELRMRFRLEGELLVSLRHPCLVRGLDYDVTSTAGWIAMEYLSGCTLEQHVSRATFTLGERMEVLLDIARAAEFLHDNGVVHRDIKPSNILVLADGGARLIDLGIARFGSLDLTPPGTLTASPYSIAPEEILECGVDHRADVFALGVVMHHLLTGEHPWPNENLYATMYARCVSPARALMSRQAGLRPLGLRAEDVERLMPVALKALARDPSDRHQSARDLITAVEDRL